MQTKNEHDYLGNQAGANSQPILGDESPRRGNRFTQWVARTIMRLAGWKLAGRLPNEPKLLIVGAPHSSNWDWVLTILTAYSLGVHISWLAKHTIFRPPFGRFFRYFGGIPVDRRSAHGLVDQIVDKYNEAEKLIVCITPEGTRSLVRAWKKGFYHIAEGAAIPITLVTFDYGNRTLGLGPTLRFDEGPEKAVMTLQALYAGVQGKNRTVSMEDPSG